MNIIFIPKYGVYGAALTSAFSFMIVNVYYYINVNLNSKSMNMEIASLFLYIVLISFIYIFFNSEISLASILSKILIVISYFFILMKIFKINSEIFQRSLNKIFTNFYK
jgi:hypothetical protein